MSNKIINSPIERFTRILFSKVIERLAVVVSQEHLSFSQVAALHIIDRDKVVNINDISSKLNLSMSATSRMIDELVKKEFIQRKEDQDNRRAKIISLTPAGVILPRFCGHGKVWYNHKQRGPKCRNEFTQKNLRNKLSS